MNETGSDASFCAETVPATPRVLAYPSRHREFEAWFVANRNVLSDDECQTAQEALDSLGQLKLHARHPEKLRALSGTAKRVMAQFTDLMAA